ncbi:MAG TPA: hypothetical protein VE999_19370 [Gemmataceae bacterium]|nr:hypothetical protein [Gemmataceae bacterium]
MRYTKIGSLAILMGAMALTAATAQAPADKTAARPITYVDLGKLVRGYRGKVVVVDLWSID